MSRKTSFKKDKMRDRILNDVNSFLRFHGHDSRLTFVSVTRVDLTDDYSKATIYWDTFDPSRKDEITEAMSEIRGKMRTHLAKSLKIRAVPEVEINYDTQYESEKQIDELLNQEKERFDK